VYQIAYSHYNMGGQMDKWMTEFKAKYNDDFYTGSSHPHLRDCWARPWPRPSRPTRSKWPPPWKACKFTSFNGEVEMRKTRPPVAAAPVHDRLAKGGQKVPLQPREHRHDLGTGQGVPQLCVQHADQLPDEASLNAVRRLALAARGGLTAAGCCWSLTMKQVARQWSFSSSRRSTALSYGLLLFMLSSGLDPDFQHDGRAQFCARQLLHAGCLCRLHAVDAGSASGRHWCWRLWSVGALGALFERLCLRRVHKFGHVPELLITFGLSYVVLELVQLVWGRIALELQPPTASCRAQPLR